MQRYTLDFMSTDPEYMIETSIYREKIRFCLDVEDMGIYFVTMKTYDSVRVNMDAPRDRPEYAAVECERGLMLVKELDLETLHQTIELALSQQYFRQQKTLQELPLRIEPHERPQFVFVEGVVRQKEYHGIKLEHLSVTVRTDGNVYYTLIIVSPEAVHDHFQPVTSGAGLAVTGIVVVRDLAYSDLAGVAEWCRRKYYFRTLRPIESNGA